LKGIFNSVWEGDRLSYMLCLVIYSTGLGNSGIARLRPKDIVMTGDCCFLNMGRKVSKDVSKRYNRKDRRGQEKMLEKAREICGILEETLFLNGLSGS
jgi:hypothetical protein